MANSQGDHKNADSNATAKVRQERAAAASRDVKAHAAKKRGF
jgi:hypothetical protein